MGCGGGQETGACSVYAAAKAEPMLAGAWSALRRLPPERSRVMAIASISHLIASHPDGPEAALSSGIDRADETLAGLRGVEVERVQAKVVDGEITEWRVTFGLTFLLASDLPLHE